MAGADDRRAPLGASTCGLQCPVAAESGSMGDMTWIPLPQAARQLGIHKRTILRWFRDGRLPTDALIQTPTGRWLVDVDKVPGLKGDKR